MSGQYFLCQWNPACNGTGMEGNQFQVNTLVPPSPAHSSTRSPFSPAVISIVGILGLAFLLVSYYTIFAKYCTSREELGRRRRRAARDAVFATDAALPMLTRGLEEALVKAIPVCKYIKGDGLVEGTECAVCLSDFEEDEFLRLLPKCNHAFHIPCIDKWLQSHSNCPLCRANIVSTVPAPPAAPGAVDLTSQGQLSDGSLEEENHSHVRDPVAQNYPRNTEGGLASTSEGLTEESVRLNREGLELQKHEGKASPQYPNGQSFAGGLAYLAHMRSFSVGSTSNNGQMEGRRKHLFSDFKRSFSLGSSSSRDIVVEFPSQPEWAEGPVTDCPSKIQGPVFSTLKEPESACVSSEQTIPTVVVEIPGTIPTVVVEIPGTGSSSSQVANGGDLKSKSYYHAMDLKSKADDLSRGKVLMSLKGPLGLRRSFSGGRLFSFMNSRGRNTAGAGADSSRPPL